MKKKRKIKPIAVAAAMALLTMFPTACTDDSDPAKDDGIITLGNIAVGTVKENTSRAATGNIDEPFWTGDELTVRAIPEGAAVADYIAVFKMNASGGWDVIDPMYVDDVKTGYTFTAIKSTVNYTDDQTTIENYHSSDDIYGSLILNGKTLSIKEGEPLRHTFVDVVLTLTPAADWGGNGDEFKKHLDEAEVVFHRTDGLDIFPYRVAGTDEYTFRAILPNLPLPTPGETLFTITPKNEDAITGTYSLPNGVTWINPGQRLTVTAEYRNVRSLGGITVTVDDWGTWEDVGLDGE